MNKVEKLMQEQINHINYTLSLRIGILLGRIQELEHEVETLKGKVKEKEYGLNSG